MVLICNGMFLPARVIRALVSARHRSTCSGGCSNRSACRSAYDKVASWATCRVAIREEALDQLLTDSSALFEAQTNDQDGACSLLVRAPGRIRTCAPRSGGACSIP